MQSGVTRLLRWALVLFALFHAAQGWGQSVIFSRSGVCTIYSADRRIRLVLEKPANGSGAGAINQDGLLQATMVSAADEKETVLWSRQIRGNIYDFVRADSVVLAEKGGWFVALPGSNDNDELGFRVYSAAAVKAFDPPIRHPWISPWMWIAGVERIGGGEVLRIWEPARDEWLAFAMPDGKKMEVTAEMTQQWNDKTRAKILDAFAQKRRKALAKELNESAPMLKRVTSMVAGTNSALRLNEAHYVFLLKRKNPDDRKLFEEMLREKGQDVSQHVFRFWGSGGATWHDHYEFASMIPDREQADALLAGWDGKTNWTLRGPLDKPHQLARVEGNVKTAAPILTRPGTIHIYLIPKGKEKGAWTNDPRAGYLECKLTDASPLQPDLMNGISFNFSSVLPGKYFLKAVWDKRAPFIDSMRAGPGDYESILTGPIEIKPGDVVTNLTVDCTKRAKEGEGYYAADAHATRLWKEGELTPSSYGGNTGGPYDVFARRADRWIVKTNVAPSDGRFNLSRVALGDIKVYRDGEKTIPALKFYFLGDYAPNTELELEIRDEQDRVFKAETEAVGNLEASRAAIVFSQFPREATRFRVIANKKWRHGKFDKEVAWDLTITNLIRTPGSK
jgi:hypothetical protein